MSQAEMFELQGLQTKITSKPGDLETLFEGFSTLRGVAYVASPRLLLDLLERRGFRTMELVVGDNLAGTAYRDELQQLDLNVTDRLARYAEDGSLRILVPPRPNHSKYFLLENDDTVRVINGSANLTDTAAKGSNQWNYVWYIDFSMDDPRSAQLIKDYESHRKPCRLFMGDLVDLFKREPQASRKEIIEAWLRGAVSGDDHREQEAAKLFQNLTAGALDYEAAEAEPVMLIQLEGDKEKQRVRSTVAALGGTVSGNQARISRAAYTKYVWETHKVPLMKVDRTRPEVVLALGGSLLRCTEELPEATQVQEALAKLEAYIETAEWGHCRDPHLAKMSLFEALLYAFSSPFFHEEMKMRRQARGFLNTRGPRFLYLYGRSRNGKSTFFKFALKLITGSSISPIPGKDFTTGNVRATADTGTAFPLIFDDVVLTNAVQNVFKMYWEVWWNEDHVSPQLILSSNSSHLHEWGKTRAKMIAFDVYFSEDAERERRLNEIFISLDNRVFRWFSGLYFQELDKPHPATNDELAIGRRVFTSLYEYAGRTQPAFIPDRALEELFDRGLQEWVYLLDQLEKAELVSEATKVRVYFADDMKDREVAEYAAWLPQNIRWDRKGRTIIIENPAEFSEWLAAGRPIKQKWFSRLVGLSPFFSNHKASQPSAPQNR